MTPSPVTAVGRLLTPKHGEPQVIDRIKITHRWVEVTDIKRIRIAGKVNQPSSLPPLLA